MAAKQQHQAKQQPVIDDVRAGRYPDVFGDDVATEQHDAGRADHQKTLQKIPVISGQVQGSEDKGSR